MEKSAGDNGSWMSAVTFAEAGEWDTARQMMPTSRTSNRIGWLHRIFVAVTFAEVGLHEEALRIVDNPQPRGDLADGFVEAIGLRGVRMTCGVLAAELVR